MTQTQQTVLTSEEIRTLELKVEEVESHPAYSHSRKGTGVWRNKTFHYLRCSDTPTGVHAVNVKEG